MADEDAEEAEKRRRASTDSVGKRRLSLDFGKRRGSLSFARWFRKDKEVGCYAVTKCVEGFYISTHVCLCTLHLIVCW